VSNWCEAWPALRPDHPDIFRPLAGPQQPALVVQQPLSTSHSSLSIQLAQSSERRATGSGPGLRARARGVPDERREPRVLSPLPTATAGHTPYAIRPRATHVRHAPRAASASSSHIRQCFTYIGSPNSPIQRYVQYECYETTARSETRKLARVRPARCPAWGIWP
jgi:hypothetical protein